MKTIVLTRPREDSEKMAAALEAQGYSVLIEPMLRIEIRDAQRELNDALAKQPQAILVTSRHGLNGNFAGSFHIPVITVGKATAEAARAKGFTSVITADGDAEALVEYVLKHCPTEKGKLLYLRGMHITTDIEAALAPHHFTVQSVIMYDAVEAQTLSDDFVTAVKNGTIDRVLFYSVRTAETYILLIKDAGLEQAHASIKAVCLSEKIGETLGALSWKNCGITHQYSMETMIQKLK